MSTVRARSFAAFASLVALGACSPSELPVTPLDEVCSVENGTTVRTEGFLTGPGGSMMCDGTTCEMALSNRGIGGSTSIRIDVRLGSGRNAMVEPPDRFSTADLVVKDNEGVEHNVGDWIIVQGRILTGEACLITPVSWVLPGSAPGADGSGAAAAPAARPTSAAPPAVPAVPPPTTPPAPPSAGGGDKPTPAAPAAPAKP